MADNWEPFQLFPLWNSAASLQSGVSEVIYFVEKRLNDTDAAYIASHRLLSMAGVKVCLGMNVCLDILGLVHDLGCCNSVAAIFQPLP